MTDDLISRLAAITLPVMPKEHREYQTFNLDDAYEQGWNDLQKCIELLPTEQERIDAAYKEGYCDCEQEWLKERRELHLTSIEVNEGGIVGKFTERKKGEWIHCDDGSVSYRCSVCGKHAYGNYSEIFSGEYHYCPNCGAEMEKGEA